VNAQILCGLADIPTGGVYRLLNVFALEFVRRIVQIQSGANDRRRARHRRQDECKILRFDPIAG